MQGFSKQLFCLFDNWQQFKSIMKKKKKKKEQTPSQNYWPAHPKPRIYGWMDVCLCFHGLYGTQIDTSSVPRPPAKIGGYRLCSHWAQLPLGKLFFYLKLSFSCLSLFPNSSPIPRSSVWKDKLVRKVALPSKFTGKQKRHKQWHPHRHGKYHLDEWMCARACVCTVAIAKKGPYSFPYEGTMW